MRQLSKWIIILILVTIVIGTLWGQTSTDVSALAAAMEVPTAVAHTVRQAAVQIRMIRIEWGEQTVIQSNESEQTFTRSSEQHIDKGIGTLLAYEGETLLVSHDHWSHLTSTVIPDLVQFHDVNGHFLLEITGDVFSQLMLFHDGGTLIMQAPSGLATKLPGAAEMGDVASLQPGNIVYVAHRPANQRNMVVLMGAEVLAIESHHNIPLLSLQSLNGQTIEPGDSGGGVWLDGRFVGNLWTTVREVPQDWRPFNLPVEIGTARSYAAGIRHDLLPLISLILGSRTLPTLLADGPS